jgi:homoserine kinase
MIDEDVLESCAFAPATISNIAVGFDLLGMAIDHVGDTVSLKRADKPGLTIESIESTASLPYDAEKNSVTIAIQEMMSDLGLDFGLSVKIKKGIPLGSGLGGSGASAVAGLCALNGFLTKPLTPYSLLAYALRAEGAVSGAAHPDNVAPALFGDLILYADGHVICLPPPPLSLVVLHVDIPVKTARARKLLPERIALSDSVRASGRMGLFVQALHQKNPDYLINAMLDEVIEPARAELWPHYPLVKKAALLAGAASVCISGSGPTVLAWVDQEGDVFERQKKIGEAMIKACEENDWQAQYWLPSLPAKGAHIVSEF